MVTAEIPTLAGFAEPVARAPQHFSCRASRPYPYSDSSGPVLLFLLLVSAFVPSFLVDVNVRAALRFIGAWMVGTPELMPSFVAQLEPSESANEAVCGAHGVADSVDPCYDGRAGLSDSAHALRHGAITVPFHPLPGARTPRAPPQAPPD